jgi:anti-sigma factor RsiW
MTDTGKPVTEEDLLAFADAQLSNGDVARVEAWLKTHPEDAARVRAWQQQNRDIQTMFAPYARSREDDEALLAAKPVQETAAKPWKMLAFQAAAAACIFALGVGVGHYAAQSRSPEPIALTALHQEASSAFLIYASEVRHPVEVRADEKDHLIKWLSKKLGHPLAAPDLSARGFSLVGGRLVPVNGRAGALLMYEDTAGKRLTILVGQSEANAVTSFRFASEGKVETFYWIDEKLSYAVTGEIPRDVLRNVADDCYQQFETL